MDLDTTLFHRRAVELLAYIKARPAPFIDTDKDLARAFFIGSRTIGRYLRYLKDTHRIGVAQHVVRADDGTIWVNRRRITPEE